jgi:hypothetical protein
MFTSKVRAPSQTSDLRPCDNLVFKILTYIQDRLLGCLSSTDPDRQHAFRTHSPRPVSASQNLRYARYTTERLRLHTLPPYGYAPALFFFSIWTGWVTVYVGSATFTGLGIYSYASGMSQLREREMEILKSGSRVTMQARRFGIFGLSSVLVGLGVYRLVN